VNNLVDPPSNLGVLRSSRRDHPGLSESPPRAGPPAGRPLTTLPALFGKVQALLMTAVYFGLEHYYGNPPALSGVLLATFLGYLLGKSMLETGGSRWAWLIHWLQDIIIFSFLVMGWSN
jgi:hypothetical protein